MNYTSQLVCPNAPKKNLTQMKRTSSGKKSSAHRNLFGEISGSVQTKVNETPNETPNEIYKHIQQRDKLIMESIKNDFSEPVQSQPVKSFTFGSPQPLQPVQPQMVQPTQTVILMEEVKLNKNFKNFLRELHTLCEKYLNETV